MPKSRYAAFFTIAGIGCVLDLWTKHFMFQWLGRPVPGPENVWWIWKDHFGFQTVENRGMLFGLGQGQVTPLAVLSVAAMAGIIYWLFAARAARDRLLTYSLGAVTGGILGNLYDRLGYWGYQYGDEPVRAVRDWILMRFGRFSWPNYNIADCLLVCGAALLMWHALTIREPAGGDEQNDDRRALKPPPN